MKDFLVEIHGDLRAGRSDLALNKCQAFVQNHPTNSVIHAELARILLRVDRYEDAKEAAKTAISLNPELSLPYAILGYTQLRQQQLQEAELNIVKALELDPKDSLSHYYLGIIHLSKGSFATAVEQFEKAIAINDQEVQFHVHLARAYLQLNRIKAAISEAIVVFRLGGISRDFYLLLTLLPMAFVAHRHPLIQGIVLFLLHVPLLAPAPISTLYWLAVGTYWVSLAALSFKSLEVRGKVILFGSTAWWILVRWLLELLQRLMGVS